jgi:hypothetical protein
MPVDFPTDEQAQRYGRYAREPTPVQLARYFYLDDADRSLIAIRRGDHNRVGLALQLCTVRFLGTFLSNLTEVPPGVVKHLAAQLGIHDPSCLSRYRERPTTQREHANEIQRRLGYRDFTDQPEHFRLIHWLYTRAWLSAERPIVLFDLTTARLAERKILLPGVTVLTRLIASIRDRAAPRLWCSLAHLPSPSQRKRLEDLLMPPTGERFSRLDQLRRAPTRISSPAMVAALARVDEIRALGISQLNLARIPPGRLSALARYAAAGGAYSIARMPEERRIATLVAFAFIFEAIAQDDSLDLLDQLINECLTRAEKQGQKHRLHTLPEPDAAALRMREVCKVVLDPRCPDSSVRSWIFESISRSQLEADVDIVGELSRTEQDRKYHNQLIRRYSTVRRFLPALLRTIHFEAGAAGQPVLKALEFLKKIEGKPKPDMDKATREILNAAWRRVVVRPDRKIDRRFYTFCVLERLQDALSRRDVYVTASERWGDPRAKLHRGQAWEAARPDVCQMLDLSPKPEPVLAQLSKQLDEAYRRVAANLPRNPAFRVERVKGKDRPVLTLLDKLDEPQSLIELREAVDALLPRVDITDAILEIHGWTGFADELTHISESNARVRDLEISICAVLVAEACNTGLEPFVRSDVPALTYRRLLWVQQN